MDLSKRNFQKMKWLVICVLLISSCANIKIGPYTYGVNRIELINDSIYCISGPSILPSYGKWYETEDTLVLESEYKKDSLSFFLYEQIDSAKSEGTVVCFFYCDSTLPIEGTVDIHDTKGNYETHFLPEANCILVSDSCDYLILSLGIASSSEIYLPSNVDTLNVFIDYPSIPYLYYFENQAKYVLEKKVLYRIPD